MMYLISVASMRYTKLYKPIEIEEMEKAVKALGKAGFNIEIYECHLTNFLPKG